MCGKKGHVISVNVGDTEVRSQLQGEAGAVAAHLSEARVHVETGQPVVATTGREEAGRGEGDRGFLPQPREGGVPSTTTE